MDTFLYVLGILAAFAALILALAVTIWIYLILCAKLPMRKLIIEIAIVAIVGLLSLGVRLAIGFMDMPSDQFVGGAEAFFHNILSMVAGFVFNDPPSLSDYNFLSGLFACIYYGIIAYAGFVFLLLITVGVNYEVYSKIQIEFRRRGRNCKFYIFTSVTHDSLVLAEDIKRHENNASKKQPYMIVFFENGIESFSRKNPLHRKIMEDGFFYLSDPRCDNKGETISILSKFGFRRLNEKNANKKDITSGKQLYIFAMADSGEYESVNADVVFDDMQAALKKYVYAKDKKPIDGLPVLLNYYVLTGGEVNYESYERRSNRRINERLNGLSYENGASSEFDWGGDERTVKDINSRIQINAVNEATLSSRSLVLARIAHLDKLADDAFEKDSAPDKSGAYRVAVIGFGKTGQHAMEELYTHTAHLTYKGEADYVPTQFIADIFDSRIEERSGLFAYNHPLFRCIDAGTPFMLPTDKVINDAKAVTGKAIEILYSECEEKIWGKEKRKKEEQERIQAEAKNFIDNKMAFPIAVMHQENGFKYPFMEKDCGETAITAACEHGVRDFIIALGNDEKNIAMANMIIDSFRRLLLGCQLAGEKIDLPHVKIYVNLMERQNEALLNWEWKDFVASGESTFPLISVIPFGYRDEMYSYATIVEDYRERLYNYGYTTSQNKKDKRYENFKNGIIEDYNQYRNDKNVTDEWMGLSQFYRLSNRSALDFSINYYKYKKCRYNDKDVEFFPDEKEGENGGVNTEIVVDKDGGEYLKRLEHERWTRFFISHGWIYADYKKTERFGNSQDGKKKNAEKQYRRGLKQHNCLCPFDKMLDDNTKKYDEGNVRLGLVESLVYDSQNRKRYGK